MSAYRNEHDLLGDKNVPSAAYYGVHTLRAKENFDITGIAIAVYPDLIRAAARAGPAPAAQPGAGFGQCHAARLALEQHHTQAVLELAKLAAYSRRGHMKALRRLVDGAIARHFQKVAQRQAEQ